MENDWMIVLTDGDDSNRDNEAALKSCVKDLGESHVHVFIIGFMVSNTEALRKMEQAAPDRISFIEASNDAALEQAFHRIAERLIAGPVMKVWKQ